MTKEMRGRRFAVTLRGTTTVLVYLASQNSMDVTFCGLDRFAGLDLEP